MPLVPHSVNVELEAVCGPWRDELSLVPGKLVVPVLEPDSQFLCETITCSSSITVYAMSHSLEPGFAITYHKVYAKLLFLPPFAARNVSCPAGVHRIMFRICGLKWFTHCGWWFPTYWSQYLQETRDASARTRNFPETFKVESMLSYSTSIRASSAGETSNDCPLAWAHYM